MAAVLPLRVIHRRVQWVTGEGEGPDKKFRNQTEFRIEDPRALGVQQFDIVSYNWGDKAEEWRCDQDRPETGWKGIPGANWKVKVRQEKLNDILRLMEQENIEYLWADCVCLNQENNAEKSAEVARMYEYYNSADRCHILLDMDEVWDPQGIVDDLKLLDHVLHSMVGAARATDAMLTPTVVKALSDWAARPWYFAMSQREVRAAAVDAGILNCYATCIRHVRALFRNLYFSRVWTFQEMLLGKHITMWGVNPLDMRCIGAFNTWMDLAIEASDKAVKLRNWIDDCREFNTRGVAAILQLIVEDLAWLTFLRVQVQGLNSARIDILSGGPSWWYDNYKGICNVFSAISIWPRECEMRQDIFQGLLGVFTGLFAEDEIKDQLSGNDIEPIAFAFFKQLSIKTGHAWTRLAISSGDRGSWDWIPVTANPKRIMTTDVFAGVVNLGVLRPKGRVKTLAITGLLGSPRQYIKFMPRRGPVGGSGFSFVFKGCNAGKKVKISTFKSEPIQLNDQMRNVVGDETGRILVQCATMLGSLFDPAGHIVSYRQRLLGNLQPMWHVTDPNAKPAGWIDRCVSGTPWENPNPQLIRVHNHSMSYNMTAIYDCHSRLYNDSTKDISCEVRMNCGCTIVAPFYFVLEAMIAVEDSFLGEETVDLDKDNRIILQDGVGLVQAGDEGKGFHIVAFGGDISAHQSYASACRNIKKDKPVVPTLPWPRGRAVVRDDFKHAVTDMMKDYGYIQTAGSGNLLICRNNPVDDYKIVGVCIDEFIENKKGQQKVRIR